MKIESNIGWCDETTNAVTGCDKISAGCKNCYAAVGTRSRVLRAQGIETWGPNGHRFPVAEFATKVRRLNKSCVCDSCHTAVDAARVGGVCDCGGRLRRIRLFADSNSDWLDDKWLVETLASFLKEIHGAPNIDFLVLTKRPENFRRRTLSVITHWATHGGGAAAEWLFDWREGKAPANAWLGTSVEDQKRADERIPQLLSIPSKIRFLSCEPLLERVHADSIPAGDGNFYDLTYINGPGLFDSQSRRIRDAKIDWVIVGAESGPHRRDCGIEAIVKTAEDFAEAGVPVFVKQDVSPRPGMQGRIPDDIWHLKQFPA